MCALTALLENTVSSSHGFGKIHRARYAIIPGEYRGCVETRTIRKTWSLSSVIWPCLLKGDFKSNFLSICRNVFLRCANMPLRAAYTHSLAGPSTAFCLTHILAYYFMCTRVRVALDGVNCTLGGSLVALRKHMSSVKEHAILRGGDIDFKLSASRGARNSQVMQRDLHHPW